MTATMTRPNQVEQEVPVDPEHEFLAAVTGIDGAVERKAAGKQTGSDLMLLSMHGITGAEFDRHKERLIGVRARQLKAGGPKGLAAALKRKADADQALADAAKTIVPRLEKLEREAETLRRELKAVKTTAETASVVLDAIETNRRHLESLLPESVREIIQVEERPIRAKHAAAIRAARDALNKIHGTPPGDGKLDRLQSAEAVLKEAIAKQDAECATVATTWRNLYFVD